MSIAGLIYATSTISYMVEARSVSLAVGLGKGVQWAGIRSVGRSVARISLFDSVFATFVFDRTVHLDHLEIRSIPSYQTFTSIHHDEQPVSPLLSPSLSSSQLQRRRSRARRPSHPERESLPTSREVLWQKRRSVPVYLPSSSIPPPCPSHPFTFPFRIATSNHSSPLLPLSVPRPITKIS